jgi:hypothetical protein
MFSPRVQGLIRGLGFTNPDVVHIPSDVHYGWTRMGAATADAAPAALGSTTAIDFCAANVRKTVAVLDTLESGTSSLKPKLLGIFWGYRIMVDDAGEVDADSGVNTIYQDLAELGASQYIQHKYAGADRILGCEDAINSLSKAVAVATTNTSANDIHALANDSGVQWIHEDPLVVDFSLDTFKTAAKFALSNGNTFLGYVDFYGIVCPIADLQSGARGKGDRMGDGSENYPDVARDQALRFITSHVGKTALPGV